MKSDRIATMAMLLNVVGLLPLFYIALNAGRVLEKLDQHEKRIELLERPRSARISVPKKYALHKIPPPNTMAE